MSSDALLQAIGDNIFISLLKIDENCLEIYIPLYYNVII